MIHYALVCENEHKFEAWFRNAEAYDEQHKRGIVSCPICMSGDVRKALMAPSVSRANSDKVSLSIKALVEDPWKAAAAKYKKDQQVEAVVIKYNKHGALASIEEGVAGLVHISEFGSEDELRAKLELGKVYQFTITFFEPKERRMTLKPVV